MRANVCPSACIAHRLLRVSVAALVFALFCAASMAGEYEDVAGLLAKPLYPSWDALRAGYSDEAVVDRISAMSEKLAAADIRSPELAAIVRETRVKLQACDTALANIRRLEAAKPDYAGVADKTLRASPALFRTDPDTNKLRGDDQAAVNALIAKGMTELVQAGVNSYQMSEEWKAYREHYADIGMCGPRLAELARKRPCLHSVGIAREYKEDDPAAGMVVSGLAAGGPADRAGVKVGDRIVGAAGEPLVVAGKWNQRAMEALSPGPRGSVLSLTVSRGGVSREFALERSLRLDNVAGLLGLRLRGSCDGAYDTDDLEMTNACGDDLTNCTVLVSLIVGDPNDPTREFAQKHVHFVRAWPSGTTLMGTYHNSGSKHIARNETFRYVRRVTVELYSDQYQGMTRYEYWNSDDRRADIRDYCKQQVSLSGNFFAKTDGLLANGDGLIEADAGVRVWLAAVEGRGTPQLSLSGVTVTVREGDRSATSSWQAFDWQGGGLLPYKNFQSAKFNDFTKPDFCEVRLQFFGTDYEHMLRVE